MSAQINHHKRGRSLDQRQTPTTRPRFVTAGPPLREEDFFCVTCVVLSSFVYWLAFCVLTCLLFHVLEFVYIATSAE
jgi:hypothetical protein